MAPPVATFSEAQSNAAEAQKKTGLDLPLKFPSPPKFDDPHKERAYLKGRLAAAFRVFSKYGFDEGVAGHITLRDPVEPSTFWVNPLGVPFAHIRASDLLRVSEEGKILESGEVQLLNSAAFMIHSAIHQARPDVMAAAHSHSVYGRSFCALGRTLDCITQDSCAFYNDHVLYDSFNGVVLAEEEGWNIARCLGSKKAALLINHGLLTVGQTVEEAVFWFVALEKSCQVQLMADAAAAGRGGTTVKIGHEEAAFTFNTIGKPRFGWFSGRSLFDVVERETKGEHLE